MYMSVFSGVPPDAVMVPACAKLVALNNVGCNSNGADLGQAENEYDTDGRCSLGQGVKRQIWEATLSSLKSKRIRGGHLIGCCQESNQDIVCESCSLGNSGCEQSVRAFLKDSICHAEGNRVGDVNDDLLLKGNCPTVMFMNIADDAKKACLTKVILVIAFCMFISVKLHGCGILAYICNLTLGISLTAIQSCLFCGCLNSSVILIIFCFICINVFITL